MTKMPIKHTPSSVVLNKPRKDSSRHPGIPVVHRMFHAHKKVGKFAIHGAAQIPVQPHLRALHASGLAHVSAAGFSTGQPHTSSSHAYAV